MTSNKEDMEIPSEIIDKLQNFHQSLEKMQEILSPLITTNINSTDVEIEPLDKARLNLIGGYALNSLFWMYLNTLGIDPKEHSVKGELEKYKSFMKTVKEIADKSKAPVLNKGAASRFVRNALWEPSEKNEASMSSNKEASNQQGKRSSNPKQDFKKKRRH
ncbi:Nuclear nucleic acid-binding protein C1D [Araneus ventricosus]|uniref:Nuclear nucleic acid-binding protein C1D n=1 Tax=Araneus ventricosus TaxID=182803 RepID=A0A4Y2D841_ARAVE|nr:Nuclear nucleic acid-binding protein C1D [Araneus ventricosus]